MSVSESVFQAARNLRVLDRAKREGTTRAEADGSAASAVAAHEAKLNPHPQYLTGVDAVQSVLAADVPVSGWTAGPAISLSAGTWLIMGTAHFIDTSAAANDVSLRIGSDVSAGAQAVASGSVQASACGVVVLASPGTITLEVNASGAGTLAAALSVNPAGNTATRIVAVRLA